MSIPKSLFPAYPKAYSQWVEHILPKLEKGQNKQAIKAVQALAKEAKVELRHSELTAKQHAKLNASGEIPHDVAAYFGYDLQRPNISRITTTPLAQSNTTILGHELEHTLTYLGRPRIELTPIESNVMKETFKEAEDFVCSLSDLYIHPVQDPLKVMLKRIESYGDLAIHYLKAVNPTHGVSEAKAHYLNEIQAYGATSLNASKIPNTPEILKAQDEHMVNAYAMAYRALEAAEKRANAFKLTP